MRLYFMEKLDYKVLITTSGTGSRLKELTMDTNKALIEVHGKSILSRIIESYPQQTQFVVTTGFKGEEVKEHVASTFPKHDITYVPIDKFQGPGSSLGYSMLQAKEQLGCPFIFHCNDTLVTGTIPQPNVNWNGGSKGAGLLHQNTQTYSSFISRDGNMVAINPKGAMEFDYFHIGLVGIFEYQKFWEYLETMYRNDPNDSTLNDVPAINLMIKNGSTFAVKEFEEWFDTGNIEGLTHAQAYLK